MIIAIVLVHHRIVFGEEEHVSAHGIGETLERRQIANILVIRFEDRGNPIFTHQRLRALHALPPHAVRVEPLLPIRHFRTKCKLGCKSDHHDLPTKA